MYALRPHLTLTAILPRLQLRNALHTSPPAWNITEPARTPKPPVELDPALQTLLEDTDLSLLRARRRRKGVVRDRKHRELEVIDADVDVDVDAPAMENAGAAEEAEDARLFPRHERKSPAASFGSRGIGAVVLPFELQRSILRLISEADKPMVHSDAARLFQEENAAEEAWSTRYTPPDYTEPSAGTRMSHIKARLARQRDGTAFASVVMPAQYAVVAAVLAGVVTRLGSDWARGVERVIDWGSGTGAGMWAALHTFGRVAAADATLASSRVTSYIGIEKREGLSTIARRLLREIPLGETTVSLKKTLHPSDRVPRIDGLGTVALSTFALSTLDNSGLRRQMVRDMWESGSDVIVVIDDASAEGFRHIADARELLLKLGRREIEASDVEPVQDSREKRGAHVIAPCPHDFACPLASAGTRCTFEQRLQRPAFVRRTKHTGQGEEDVGYAYVVVRRGLRPQAAGDVEAAVVAMTEGRLGAVGRWAEDAARAKELAREDHTVQQARWEDVTDEEAVEVADEAHEVREDDVGVVEEANAEAVAMEGTEVDTTTVDKVVAQEAAMTAEDGVAETVLVDQALEDALRLEAYNWPRINFPPLKRSGHIIVDACMPDGHEMRLTFPRSQGKQIFYDARKSAWGDIFPHTSKHRPIPRYAGPRQSGRGSGGDREPTLAKAGVKAADRARQDAVLKNTLKANDRRRRRERRQKRAEKEMGEDSEPYE